MIERDGGRPVTLVRLGAATAVALVLSACTVGGSSGSDAASKGTASSTTSSAPPVVMECGRVDAHGWNAAANRGDMASAVGAGEFPSPLAPDSQAGPPDTATLYPTAAHFLAQSNVPDPAAREQVMVDNGYVGGIEADFPTDGGFKVTVLNFAGPEEAANYFQARLPNICAVGGTGGTVEGLGAPLAGITWVDAKDAVHADFIMGGSTVSMVICGCVPDPSTTKAQVWFEAWMEAFAFGPPEPID